MMSSGILSVLQELEATSSSSKKQEILARHASQNLTEGARAFADLLRRVFYLALSPRVVFGVKQLPEIQRQYKPSITLELALSRVESEVRQRSNATLKFIEETMRAMPAQDQDVLLRVLKKDLRCGIGKGLVNKVWPGLIEDYPVMLCHEWSKQKKHIEFPAIAQVKMDAARANLRVTKKGYTLVTRSGSLIEDHGRLEVAANRLRKWSGREEMLLDGELLAVGKKKTSGFLPRKVSNGMVNKAVHGTISKDEAQRFVFVVWDMLPLGLVDGDPRAENVPYHTRLGWVTDFLEYCGSAHDMGISVVEGRLVRDEAELISFYEQMRANGEEGVIVKNRHSFWEPKRSKHWLKLKAENEIDLRIESIELGTGKYSKVMGNMLLASDDGKIRVSVGTGFSDEQRAEFYKNRKTIVGTVAAIRYNELIASANRKEMSLFLPRFVELRCDKDTTDCLD